MTDEEITHNLDLTTDDKYSLIKWIQENKIQTIHSNEPTIEDIFIQLIGGTSMKSSLRKLKH